MTTKQKLDIVGVHEIAEMAAVSADLAAVWNSRGKLPEPDATIGAGRTKVWLRSTIDNWLEER